MNVLKFQTSASPQGSRDLVCRVLLANLDSLYSTARRLSGSMAEDLVQETARKALQSAPVLQHEQNVRAWLFKILLNAMRDHLRHDNSREETSLEDQELEANLDLESLTNASTQDVRQALSCLSPMRQAVVVLIDIEGFTLTEAAGMLGVPVGTAASRLARARLELRVLLKDYEAKSPQKGG